MIDILKEYKGKVVVLYVKGNQDSFSGIIDKINEESYVLKMQCAKRYIFININDISVIMEQHHSIHSGDFEDHVIPNAFI